MIDADAVVSISELNRLARQCLERGFPLRWVSGEVSNLTRAASGHVYFSLKDDSAQARCVMFRSRAQSIPWRLENGQQVDARVAVTLYEPRGDFQLNVDSLRRAGTGRLFEAFARLKARLEAEGLFAPECKRPLPRLPKRIGIVCSPRAAALQDVLAALQRRASHLGAVLYPTSVQGDTAAGEIAAAIGAAGRRGECDLLLIVRGGGSIEDLWAFNEETVARAIANSAIPTISGIGHESDVTIADLVADLRAATPTAAAEIATQGWRDAQKAAADLAWALQRAADAHVRRLQQRTDRLSLRLVHPATRLARARNRIELIEARLQASLGRRLGRCRQQVQRAQVRLARCVPTIDAQRGRLALSAQALTTGMATQLGRRRDALARLDAALAHLNPEGTLARGFAIVRDQSGRLVRDAAQLKIGEIVTLRLARGEAEAGILARRSKPDSVAN